MPHMPADAPVDEISGSGSTNKLTKFSSGTAVTSSQVTDDGTHVITPDLTFIETDLGALGAGPLDLDLSAYTGSCRFKFTCALGGTVIRSIKRVNTTGSQFLVLRNMSNSTSPGDYVCVLQQDNPAATYRSIHLEGRQPWHVIPALGEITLTMDAGQTKWFAQTPLYFQCAPRPIPITPATMANTNVDDYSPTDAITGLDGKYASWWRLIPQASTRLCGIEGSAPTAGSNWARRILLTNYGAATMTIAHNNSSGGASTYQMYCPGATDFSLRTLGSVWVIYDEANTLWMVEAA